MLHSRPEIFEPEHSATCTHRRRAVLDARGRPGARWVVARRKRPRNPRALPPPRHLPSTPTRARHRPAPKSRGRLRAQPRERASRPRFPRAARHPRKPPMTSRRTRRPALSRRGNRAGFCAGLRSSRSRRTQTGASACTCSRCECARSSTTLVRRSSRSVSLDMRDLVLSPSRGLPSERARLVPRARRRLPGLSGFHGRRARRGER